MRTILAILIALVGGFMASAGGYNILFKTPEPYPARLIGGKDVSWESHSLPIGNGSIGANIIGSISTERITFNEKTLWRGGPNVGDNPAYYWDVNKSSAHLLKDIRRAFADGDSLRADSLVRNNFNGVASYNANTEDPYRFGNFVGMGEFLIDTDIDESTVSGYTRSLSLDSAVVTVAFSANNVKYKREYFISYPDNVMVAKFSSERPQHLTLRYSPNQVSDGVILADGSNAMRYEASLIDNRMRYVVRVAAITDGHVTNIGQQLSVMDANEVTFIVAADTDYKINFSPDFNDPHTYVGVNPLETTQRWVAQALDAGYDMLLARHKADYGRLFNTVELTLGTDSYVEGLSTPERLQCYRDGSSDRYLEELYFQYGRYLLISSSRPGTLPANLQGIWHNGDDGPWHVDYHNNINIQMNYWPACVTGLSECMIPMIDYIRMLYKPGKVTAKSYYDSEGWTASISSNVFGFTAPLDSRDMSWNLSPMSGPWLATHLWEYYDYTRDEHFLRDVAYDLIKESAAFVCDYLWQDSDGYYTACPSTSPEHGPIDSGATFVHAVCRELLADAIQAASVLAEDSIGILRWADVLSHIKPYIIGRYGQLMEWSSDIDNPADKHRHLNHLFGLHPGSSIVVDGTPDLANACRVVLQHRGDGATGWSMGWKLNQWARLHDGNHAYSLYGNLLKQGTLDNLWDTHPPFQIDGNFGGIAGVAEMLLQSHNGVIQLLPALPDAWQTGRFRGLVARGGFVIAAAWNDCRPTEIDVTSLNGGKCCIRFADSKLELNTVKGTTYKLAYTAQRGLFKIF
jgi:alpha-L-fucosidase 2